MANKINLKTKSENEQKKIKNKVIIILILLFIIIFLLIVQRIGKLGIVPISAEAVETIKITENDINFDKLQELNIFANPEFENKKIIAPHSKGTYKFKIENTTDENINYDILMTEENNLNINMKYRLKLDNVYIIGNKDTWEGVEKLNINDIIVTADSRNIYTLEWFWEDNINDTQIGEAVYAEYKLHINVNSQNMDE